MKKKEESILYLFPMMFFLLGLFQQSLINAIEDSPLVWTIFLLGLLIYFLLVEWFYLEVKRMKGGLTK